MPFNLERALKEGTSYEDIARYLADTHRFNLQKAIQDGATNEQIAKFLAPQEKPTKGVGEAFVAGLGESVPGLAIMGELPSPPPMKETMGERVARQVGTVAGDIPLFVAGGAIAAPAGPVVSTAAAMALPAGLRKVLIDRIQKGDIDAVAAIKEAAKGAVIGVATGVVGKFIPGIAKIPAEIAAMTTVGAGLEGRLPTAREFVDASIVLGGLHVAFRTPAGIRRLREAWKVSKRPPIEIAKAPTPEEARILGIPMKPVPPAPEAPQGAMLERPVAAPPITEVPSRPPTKGEVWEGEGGFIPPEAVQGELPLSPTKPPTMVEVAPSIPVTEAPTVKVQLYETQPVVYKGSLKTKPSTKREVWEAVAGIRFEGVQEVKGRAPIYLYTDMQEGPSKGATFGVEVRSADAISAKLGEVRKRFEVAPSIELVQRYEEPGIGVATFDKPQGIYTTPYGVTSPHADLGGEQFIWRKNSNAKVLKIDITQVPPEITMRKGARDAGANIWALQKLVGKEEFLRLKELPTNNLLTELKNKFPTVNWERAIREGGDKQDVLEGLGGVLARKAGYDAIETFGKEKEWNEYVGLTEKSMTLLTKTQVPSKEGVIKEVERYKEAPKPTTAESSIDYDEYHFGEKEQPEIFYKNLEEQLTAFDRHFGEEVATEKTVYRKEMREVPEVPPAEKKAFTRRERTKGTKAADMGKRKVEFDKDDILDDIDDTMPVEEAKSVIKQALSEDNELAVKAERNRLISKIIAKRKGRKEPLPPAVATPDDTPQIYMIREAGKPPDKFTMSKKQALDIVADWNRQLTEAAKKGEPFPVHTLEVNRAMHVMSNESISSETWFEVPKRAPKEEDGIELYSGIPLDRMGRMLKVLFKKEFNIPKEVPSPSIGSSFIASDVAKDVSEFIKSKTGIKAKTTPEDISGFVVNEWLRMPTSVAERIPMYRPVQENIRKMWLAGNKLKEITYITTEPYWKLKRAERATVNRVFYEIDGSKRALSEEQLRSAYKMNDSQIAAYKGVRKELTNIAHIMAAGMREAKVPEEEIDAFLRNSETYFPHQRYGSWGVMVKRKGAADPIYLEMFETDIRGTAKGKAQRAVQAYRKQYSTPDYKVTQVNWKDKPEEFWRDLPSNKQIDSIAEYLRRELPKASDVVDQMLRDLRLTKGFSKHFIARKNIPGYSKNAERVLATYLNSAIGWQARQLYAQKIFSSLGKIDAQRYPNLYKFASENVHYVLSSRSQEFSRVRGALFYWYLGLSPKSAFVNATQNFVTAAPALSSYSGKNGFTQIYRAMKDIATKSLTEEELVALEQAKRLGTTRDLMVEEFSAKSDEFMTETMTKKAAAALRYMFSTVEVYNRETTLLAFFRAARAKGVPLEQAIEGATRAVDNTHFIYGKYNRPKLARGLGAPLMTFRLFGLHYLNFLNNSLSRGEYKTVAQSLGAVLALSGIAGIPAFNTLNGVYHWVSDRNAEEDIRKVLNEMSQKLLGDEHKDVQATIADSISYGALSTLGVYLSGSVGMGDILPSPSIDKIIGVLGDIPRRGRNILQDIRSGNYLRAIEDSSPEFVRNPLAAVRQLNGIYTRGGSPITDEMGKPIRMTPYQAAIKSIGFQPIEISKRYKVSELIKQKEGDRSQLKKAYLDSIMVAIAKHDNKLLQEIWADLREYNKDKDIEDKIFVKYSDIQRRYTLSRAGGLRAVQKRRLTKEFVGR